MSASKSFCKYSFCLVGLTVSFLFISLNLPLSIQSGQTYENQNQCGTSSTSSGFLHHLPCRIAHLPQSSRWLGDRSEKRCCCLCCCLSITEIFWRFLNMVSRFDLWLLHCKVSSLRLHYRLRSWWSSCWSVRRRRNQCQAWQRWRRWRNQIK